MEGKELASNVFRKYLLKNIETRTSPKGLTADYFLVIENIQVN
jgi:hypothetical protein